MHSGSETLVFLKRTVELLLSDDFKYLAGCSVNSAVSYANTFWPLSSESCLSSGYQKVMDQYSYLDTVSCLSLSIPRNLQFWNFVTKQAAQNFWSEIFLSNKNTLNRLLISEGVCGKTLAVKTTFILRAQLSLWNNILGYIEIGIVL